MSRAGIYPWDMLQEVGDYFAVPETFKPYAYMSALVSQRNYKEKGNRRYSCERTTYGSIVLLAQIREEIPDFDFCSDHGIMTMSVREMVGKPKDLATPLGDRIKAPERTQEQIVAGMSQQVKEANLPWWRDPKGGGVIVNQRVATKKDIERWIRKEWVPNPEAPYPDYYNLDENLMKKNQERLIFDDEVEDEDFGDHPSLEDDE